MMFFFSCRMFRNKWCSQTLSLSSVHFKTHTHTHAHTSTCAHTHILSHRHAPPPPHAITQACTHTHTHYHTSMHTQTHRGYHTSMHTNANKSIQPRTSCSSPPFMEYLYNNISINSSDTQTSLHSPTLKNTTDSACQRTTSSAPGEKKNHTKKTNVPTTVGIRWSKHKPQTIYPSPTHPQKKKKKKKKRRKKNTYIQTNKRERNKICSVPVTYCRLLLNMHMYGPRVRNKQHKSKSTMINIANQ